MTTIFYEQQHRKLLTEKHLIIFCRAAAYFKSRIKIVKFDSSLYKISRKSSDSLIYISSQATSSHSQVNIENNKEDMKKE